MFSDLHSSPSFQTGFKTENTAAAGTASILVVFRPNRWNFSWMPASVDLLAAPGHTHSRWRRAPASIAVGRDGDTARPIQRSTAARLAAST